MPASSTGRAQVSTTCGQVGNRHSREAASLGQGGRALFTHPTIVGKREASTCTRPLGDDKRGGQAGCADSRIAAYPIRVTPALASQRPRQEPFENSVASAQRQLTCRPPAALLHRGCPLLERLAQSVQRVVVRWQHAAIGSHRGAPAPLSRPRSNLLTPLHLPAWNPASAGLGPASDWPNADTTYVIWGGVLRANSPDQTKMSIFGLASPAILAALRHGSAR
jgi:hypothetical protein